MSAGVMGLAITDAELRLIPKHGLNLSEVNWAYGSPQVVRRLKEIGALVPVADGGRTLLFDAEHVAQVWAAYRAGIYAGKLEQLGRV